MEDPSKQGDAVANEQVKAEAKAAKAKPKSKPAKSKPAKKQAAKPKAKAKTAKKKSAKSGELSGPAVLKTYAPQYHKDTDKKTSGGNTSVDCNDDVAQKLRGKDLDQVYSFAAKALKEDEKELRSKYKHLNVGMQRMNLGNRVRAVLNAK